MVIWLNGQPVVLLACYFRPGGWSQTNQTRLRRLAAVVRCLGLPWVAFADWNLETCDLELRGRILQARITTPKDTVATCTAGEGRLLDYVVPSEPDGGDIIKQACGAPGTTWRPHCGVGIHLNPCPEAREGSSSVSTRFPAGRPGSASLARHPRGSAQSKQRRRGTSVRQGKH